MDNDDKILYDPNEDNDKNHKYKDEEIENFIKDGEENINGLDDIESIDNVGYMDQPLTDEPLSDAPSKRKSVPAKGSMDDEHLSYKDEIDREHRQDSRYKDDRQDIRDDDRRYQDEQRRDNKDYDDRRYREEQHRDDRDDRDYDDRRYREEQRRDDRDYDDRRYREEQRRDDRDYDDRRYREDKDDRNYDDRRYRDEQRRDDKDYDDRRYREEQRRDDRDYDDHRDDERYQDYTSLKDEINKAVPKKPAPVVKKPAEGNKTVNRKPNKSREKSNFSVFMAFMAVIAIAVFVITLTLVAKKFRVGNENGIGSQPSNPIATLPSKADKVTNSKAIVLEVEDDKKLRLYDFQNGLILDLLVDKNTKITDNYNKALVVKELKTGDIADIEFYTLEKNIIEFQISSDIWEKKNANNITINKSAETITIADKVYNYDDRIIVTYKGEETELANLSKSDIVTAKGYGNSILYIEILKSHGVIEIANKDLVKEGTLEIGTIFYTKLSESQGIFDVPEGKYHIIVKGVNIENYSTEVEIKEGHKTIVDLSEVTIKSGALSVKLNPQDAVLSINGEVKSAAQPVVLDYGKYTVKAEKEGYKAQEIEVTINQPLVNVEFRLDDLVIYGIVNIATDPAGADVYIDDVNYGKSPISENVPVGNHTITVRKEGYEDLSSPINVTESGNSAEIKMQPVQVQNTPAPMPTEEIQEPDFGDLVFPDN